MEPSSRVRPIWPNIAWFVAALSGVLAPAVAMVVLFYGLDAQPFVGAGALMLAIALMATGMITGSIDGSFPKGLMRAAATGGCLTLLAVILGSLGTPNVLTFTIAILAASISFAARGALFARSGGNKGWWIAVFVVAGEAAIVLTALAEPGALPAWLLALLPAQWASIALQSALAGAVFGAAWAPLVALLGTAAATLVVVHQWPRKWTYAIMFTTWLALSALVYHQSGAVLA